MSSPSLIPITGNTYPVRDQLRQLGATWNPAGKAWMVSPEQAEQARAIVASAPAGRAPSSSYGRSRYRSDAFSGRNQSRYGGRCNCEDYPCCGH